MKQRDHDDDELLDKTIWWHMVRANSKCESMYWARKLGEHLAKRTIERINAALDAAGLTKQPISADRVALR